MSRTKRILRGVGYGIGILIIVVLAAVLILAQTDWARNQVRQIALTQLADVIEGDFTLERIEGNLLRGPSLINITIVDGEGRPFVQADTLTVGYSLFGFLRQRVTLRDVEIANAEIILDKPPGEEWNFMRIFMPDPPDPEREPSNWGNWIDLRGLSLRNVYLAVRSEWEAAEDLTPEEAQEALHDALTGESRNRVVAVEGGYQSVMEFSDLYAELPQVTIARPDIEGMPVEVASFAGIAQPFHPPAAVINDLSGSFLLRNDTLHFRNIAGELPATELEGDGFYTFDAGDLYLELDAHPVALSDLRWLYPPLPEEGGGSLKLALKMASTTTTVVAEEIDLTLNGASVTGKLGMTVGDTLRLSDTRLHIADLPTELIEQFAPDFDLAMSGILNGRLAVDGTMDAMSVDVDLAFEDRSGRYSQVLASGDIELDNDVTLDDFSIRLDPLETDHVRAFVPDLPVHGRLFGHAHLDGTTGGRMIVDADLRHNDPRAGMSRLTAAGAVDMGEAIVLHSLDVELAPLQLGAVAAESDAVPPGAFVTGTARVDGPLDGVLSLAAQLQLTDPAAGTGNIAVNGGLAFAEAISFRELAIDVAGIPGAMLRTYVDGIPPGLVATGSAALNGRLDQRVNVTARVNLDHANHPRSTLAVSGGVAMRDALTFDGVNVDFDPLHLALIETVMPDVEADGIVYGRTSIEGSLESGLDFTTDLRHIAAETSRVTGHGSILMGDDPDMAVDLRLEPLSMELASYFVADTEFTGHLRGSVRVRTWMDDIHIDAALTDHRGGRINLAGAYTVVQPASARYDVRLNLTAFDPSNVMPSSPVDGRATGAITLAGSGLDPAFLRARLTSDIMIEDVLDTGNGRFRLDVNIAEGLARFSSSDIRLADTRLSMDGSFGIIDNRSGELQLTAKVDSLHHLAPWIGVQDTSVVLARPSIREERMRQAEEEFRAAVRQAQVAYMAAGERQNVDFTPSRPYYIPRDTLAGSIKMNAVLSGNIALFSAAGTLEAEELMMRGNYVGDLGGRFDIRNIGSETINGELDISAEDALAAGYSIASADIRAVYEGGRYGDGSINANLLLTEGTSASVDSDFVLSLEQNEVLIGDMAVEVDSVRWQSAGEGRLAWGGAGLDIENILLESNTGGRIFAHGAFPLEGTGDLRFEIENLEVADIIVLIQSDMDVAGRLDLVGTLRGTQSDPQVELDGTLTSVRVDGAPMPALVLDAVYRAQLLEGSILAEADSRSVLDATVSLPIDLSFAGDTGRLLEAPIEVDVTANRLPLDAVSAFVDAAEIDDGWASAEFTIRGTPQAPEVSGTLLSSVQTIGIAPLGLEITDLRTSTRLEDRRLVIEEMRAFSNGPINISGHVDLSDLRMPVFELAVTAEDAGVINTEDATLRADADLQITGPMDAVRVEGEVRTRRGVIYIPELAEFGGGEVVNLDDPVVSDRLDPSLDARRAVLTEQATLVENLEVDIDVIIDRDVWLRSTEANVEIYTPPDVGPLHVWMRGMADEIRLNGTVNTDRGRYEFMSRRFDLTRGSVTFQGGDEINPILQVAAEHEIQLPGEAAFAIRITLGGTVQDLEIALDSDAQPPISQTDLLSFLAFGRDASTLTAPQASSLSGQGSGSGALVGNVAAMATQQLAAVALGALVSDFEQDAARSLGLDLLRITPADLPADIFTGSYIDVLRGTHIEAGSYVIPDIFVSAEFRPTFVQPGLRLEYRFGPGYQATTTWRARYLPNAPTLISREPETAGVLGVFLSREWRF